MLARTHRIDIRQPNQAEQGDNRGRDFFAQHLAIIFPGDGWRFEGIQDADRNASIRSWRVDGKMGGVF